MLYHCQQQHVVVIVLRLCLIQLHTRLTQHSAFVELLQYGLNARYGLKLARRLFTSQSRVRSSRSDNNNVGLKYIIQSHTLTTGETTTHSHKPQKQHKNDQLKFQITNSRPHGCFITATRIRLPSTYISPYISCIIFI